MACRIRRISSASQSLYFVSVLIPSAQCVCPYALCQRTNGRTSTNTFSRFVFSALTAALLQNGHCACRSWQKVIIKCVPNYPSGKLSNFIGANRHSNVRVVNSILAFGLSTNGIYGSIAASSCIPMPSNSLEHKIFIFFLYFSLLAAASIDILWREQQQNIPFQFIYLTYSSVYSSIFLLRSLARLCLSRTLFSLTIVLCNSHHGLIRSHCWHSIRFEDMPTNREWRNIRVFFPNTKPNSSESRGKKSKIMYTFPCVAPP